jgi:hypothetical protein
MKSKIIHQKFKRICFNEKSSNPFKRRVSAAINKGC